MATPKTEIYWDRSNEGWAWRLSDADGDIAGSGPLDGDIPLDATDESLLEALLSIERGAIIRINGPGSRPARAYSYDEENGFVASDWLSR